MSHANETLIDFAKRTLVPRLRLGRIILSHWRTNSIT